MLIIGTSITCYFQTADGHLEPEGRLLHSLHAQAEHAFEEDLILHFSIELEIIPFICHFFTQTKFLENKIYTKKTLKLRQNTQ